MIEAVNDVMRNLRFLPVTRNVKVTYEPRTLDHAFANSSKPLFVSSIVSTEYLFYLSPSCYFGDRDNSVR